MKIIDKCMKLSFGDETFSFIGNFFYHTNNSFYCQTGTSNNTNGQYRIYFRFYNNDIEMLRILRLRFLCNQKAKHFFVFLHNKSVEICLPYERKECCNATLFNTPTIDGRYRLDIMLFVPKRNITITKV